MTDSPSDHDLLIMHSAQLATACGMIKDTNRVMSDFIVRIDDRCAARQAELQITKENTMHSSTFWKILTILVVILMGMIATMGMNRTMTITNEIQIRHNTELIEKNGVMLEKILSDIIPRMPGSHYYKEVEIPPVDK